MSEGGVSSVGCNDKCGELFDTGCGSRGFFEGVVVSIVLYGAEVWGAKTEERRRLNMFEKKCLRDSWNNAEG